MRFLAKLSVAALAAVATAVPHAGRHRTHGHRNAHANKNSIVGRSSFDGSCGAWGGAMCPPGSCCGPNNWCGNSEAYCGAGCQAAFGQCGSVSAAPLSSAPQPSSAAHSGPPSEPPSAPQPSASESSVSSDSSNSSDSIDSKLDVAAIPKKAPANYGPWQSRPTGGAPIPTLYTAVSPGGLPSSSPGTSVPASSSNPQPTYSVPTTQSTTLPSSPAGNPTSPAVPTSGPPSSGPPTSSTSGSPAPSPTSGGGGGGGQSQGGAYIKTYKGDGSSAAGWPSQEQWLNFENLWEINQQIMKSSCSGFNQRDNSDQELADIKSSIQEVSASTGVDPAFAFVIMMQESNGCVRVWQTAVTHANPGLYQSHEGTGTCNTGTATTAGKVQDPCPSSAIHQMVKDGVDHTDAGDGLQPLLSKAGGQGAQNYYKAARMYNSGSLDGSGDLGRGGATHCYCSDIANRLLGWSQGPTGCDPNTVGQ